MSTVHSHYQHQKAIQLACTGDSTVLLLGATGTGKSSLARDIHFKSARREKPFVTVNLASLHEGTLESELFGHEKGSFTGADQRRIGKLELAHGGTVFLDEIGDLSLRLQARLLEFLQSRVISPVGSNRQTKLDVRVIAATHQQLDKKVREGQFREDLLHRLRVLTVKLPSLSQYSDRFGDIVHEVLESVSSDQKKRILRLDPAFASTLEAYSWPGNFRELKNVLEFAVMSADSEELRVEDLPEWFQESLVRMPDSKIGEAGVLGVAELALSMDFYESTARFEREYLRRALLRFGGRVNLTARKTGVNKTTLIRRLRQLGIHPTLGLNQESSGLAQA